MQPEIFRKLAGHWLTGVSVVTTLDQNGVPVGMTMNAVTSLSLDPPRFLICVDNRAKTLAAIVARGHFCINYLRQDQENLASAFARRGEDRFAALAHRVENTGSPVLEGAIAFIECTVRCVCSRVSSGSPVLASARSISPSRSRMAEWYSAR